MTIWVDELYDWKQDGSLWAHMMSDTSNDELHTFAQRLGLKRSWFHNGDHYDLKPSKHALALRYGARPCSKFELVKLRISRRKKFAALDAGAPEGK
jgi:hypothetical protein